MDNLYSENIIDHYRYPRNFGRVQNFQYKSEENNPSCGDRMEVGVNLEKENNQKGKCSYKIKDLRFWAQGCAVSIAAGSMLSQKIKGQKVGTVLKLGICDIEKLFGVKISPARFKCALLFLDTLKAVLRQNT